MLVYIRGAGDIATGIATRLHRAGFQIVMSDLAVPTSVRRTVSFSEAVRLGEQTVEGIKAVCAQDVKKAQEILEAGDIAVIPDPSGETCLALGPRVVVDSILAKRNMGTRIDMAEVVIGIGPGFTAGVDCDAVIETMRGHTLGRVIYEGSAIANTGVPGNIGGFTSERVMRSQVAGIYHPIYDIGTVVEKEEVVAEVLTEDGERVPVKTQIGGLIRGMLQDGVKVTKGFKCGDVDPRGAGIDYHEVSDKALAVAGGVLEAILNQSEAIR